jgi:hypothetical protein
VGVIVLTNGDDAGPQRIADRAMQLIGQPLAGVASPASPPQWDPSWRRFAGLYRSMWGDEQVVDLKDSLVLINPEADDPQASMMKLIPAGGGAFKLDGPTGGAAIGEQVKFTEGPDGKVRGMIIGLSPSERVN